MPVVGHALRFRPLTLAGVRFLIAPDKFKGSLTARAAADAMAAGVRSVAAEAGIDLCPLADGGEGTLDALITATGGRVEWREVCGPLPGMRVRAPVGWLPGDRTAVVELATASGLQLLPHEQRDPTRTTTFGTGELIAYAVARGATKVIVGVGGSATCDGGLGIAQACGASIRLRNGKHYAAGDRKLTGADTAKVVRIGRREGSAESADAVLRFAGVEIVAACDVGNILFGPDGAAPIFAPQKGASATQVKRLDDGLRSMATRLGLDRVAEAPAAGAGGGVGFGLMGWFGARAVSGASVIFDHVDLAARLDGVDWCLTGEGRFDRQSLAGKAPMAVAQACRKAGVPCVVVAGSFGEGIDAAHAEGVTAIVSILQRPMALVEASEHAYELVEATVAQLVRVMTANSEDDR